MLMKRVVAVPAVVASAVFGADPAAGQVDNGQGETLFGDVDGDGFVDKVRLETYTGISETCRVFVEVNNGFGGYHPTVTYSFDAPGTDVTYCPDMGVVTDLGGDGVAELVVTWWVGPPPGVENELLVLRDFAPAEGFRAIWQPQGIGLADFNGDGLDDVYEYTDQGEGFRTYLNTPAGTLVPGPVQHTGVNAQDFELADFDGDGAMDLLAAYLNEDDPGLPWNGVNVVLDDGTVVPIETEPLDDAIWEAQVLDDNGDGIADVATTDPNTGSVFVYLGNGDGTFTAAK